MGRRFTQRTAVCDDCGRTPEDGEYMWYMGAKEICEKCIDTHGEEEVPEYGDTNQSMEH